MMKKLSVAAMLALIVSGITGCTQKRPQVFSQGQGSNLDTIESWSTRFVDVTTGKSIGTPPTTNAQGDVRISPDVRNKNHFELVTLNIGDPKVRELVESPPFRARAHSPVGIYQLQIKLTDNYLKIYKVGRPQDLPFEEHFYKEETFEDGRISIPLLGYKIKSYYRIEPERTADDRESHHLIEVEEDDPARATHVRIDWGSRELFEAVTKVDLFPADFFFAVSGQGKDRKLKPHVWYYAETIAEKSIHDSTTIVGGTAQHVKNSKLNPATKVVFLPREGELRVVNVARDERLSRDQIQNSADLSSEATLLLPIQWRNYRTKSEGKALSLKGERVEDVKWNERDFFEINFLQLESAAIAHASNPGTNRLIDVEIDSNYFSFTILNLAGSKGRKIRYSFLRADGDRPAYTPKRSYKEDRSKFGFFTTVRPYFKNWQYFTESDFSRREYTSRFNPERKEIVFHLSMESPRELERIASDAVAAWDRAFAEALRGTGREMRIRLATERTQLGDLRYNTIHLVDTINEESLLGLGPSVTDPETGEIVSATSNIYVSTFQSIAAETVRQYIIDRLEKRLPSQHGAGPTAIIANPVKFAPAAHLATSSAKLDAAQSADVDTPPGGPACQYASTIAANSSDEEIRQKCPEIEKIVTTHIHRDFFARHEGAASWNAVWDDTNKPADANDPKSSPLARCSRRITEDKLVSTLIHELGHNFGLRHNFYGSVDQVNFRQVKTPGGKTITPQTSSSMEYTVWEEDRLTEAGAYDIAAIRFGYGEHVELKDGKAVRVNGDQTIDEAVRVAGKSQADLKPYLYCSDEEEHNSFDALCRMHDHGTTPDQIVKYYINDYNRVREIARYRRVSPDTLTPTQYANYYTNRIFIPLREIYDQWRYHLGEYVRKSNRYLTDETPESYAALLKRMDSDPVYGPIYREYHGASQQIFGFFRDVAFASNQYCLIQEGGSRRAIEFNRLRDLLSEATRGSTQIRKCAEARDAELAQVLGEPSAQVIDEIGEPLHSYRFNLAATVEDSVIDDVVGNSPTRERAGLMLSVRLRNQRNKNNRFRPNFLDEPNLFEELSQKLVDRAVKGVRFDPSLGFEQPVPLFQQEATLYSQIWKSFKTGLDVPNANDDGSDLAASRARSRSLRVRVPHPAENLSKEAAVLMLDNRPAYSTDHPDSKTVGLINAYQETAERLLLRPIGNVDLKDFRSFLANAPAQSALSALSLHQIASMHGQLQPIKEQMGALYPCLLRQSKPLSSMEALFERLLADYHAQPSKDQKAALLAQPLQAYVQGKPELELLASRENLRLLEPLIETCVGEQNKKVKQVDKYRRDWDAQKTLLLNVLDTLAQ